MRTYVASIEESPQGDLLNKKKSHCSQNLAMSEKLFHRKFEYVSADETSPRDRTTAKLTSGTNSCPQCRTRERGWSLLRRNMVKT